MSSRLALDRQYRWPGVLRARSAIISATRDRSRHWSLSAGGVRCGGVCRRRSFRRSSVTGLSLDAERVDFWWPSSGRWREADGLSEVRSRQCARRGRPEDAQRAIAGPTPRRDRGVELVPFGWEDVISHCPDLRTSLARSSEPARLRRRRVRLAPAVPTAGPPHLAHLAPVARAHVDLSHLGQAGRRRPAGRELVRRAGVVAPGVRSAGVAGGAGWWGGARRGRCLGFG